MIEFIYTFEDRGQEFLQTPQYTLDDLSNEENLKGLALSLLNEEEQAELIKVSCCVNGLTANELPKWYLECNGKLWFN